MTDKSSREEADPQTIKESLDKVVEKLDQTESSSESWSASIAGNRQKWEELKEKMHQRQKALKALVTEKKAGTIGHDEFNRRYRQLQDELAEIEFQIYNMRLGTHVEP